jgi:hypothetical protein
MSSCFATKAPSGPDLAHLTSSSLLEAQPTLDHFAVGTTAPTGPIAERRHMIASATQESWSAGAMTWRDVQVMATLPVRQRSRPG